MKDKLSAYIQLTRLNRPIGIYLLLWPTLWALWVAGAGRPDAAMVAIFVAGVVIMRSAGCVINDYADRHFDPHVERTRTRPLASGMVSEKEALILFFVLMLAAFALALLLPWLALMLSVGGAGLAIIYPFMKRHTHLPQFFLGAAFAWAIPMAFAALRQSLDPRLWWWFAATLVWAMVYDTIYAIVDREDDLKIKVKSTAILFAHYDRLIIGILQAIMLGLLVLAGRAFELGYAYYLSLPLVALLMFYHQWLIREHKPSQCFKAFLHNHWIGLVVFAGIVLHYILTPEI